MTSLKIVWKSFYRKNLGNQSLILCTALLLLLPTVLYSVSSTTAKQVEASQKAVFGGFSDILYEPTQHGVTGLNEFVQDTADFLNGFTFSEKGTLATVYSEDLHESRKLNIGYADESALRLASVTLQRGTMPEAANEIALTESIALHYNTDLGKKININAVEYSVCGVASDFGRLWVHGEEQEQLKITPPNAFLTAQSAETLLKETRTITRQILLVQSEANRIIQTESPYHFTNTSRSDAVKFQLPNEFAGISLAVSLAVLSMLVLLNRKKLQKRIATYFRLGLTARKIQGILYLELLLCFLLGGFAGGVASVAGIHACVYFVSGYIKQPIDVYVDFVSFFKFFAALLAGLGILAAFYFRHTTRKAIAVVQGEGSDKTKQIRLRNRFSFRIFTVKKYAKSYALLVLVVAFSFALISYGLFYGNCFRRDITESAPGTLPRDYDFQFVTRAKSAVPWNNHDDPILFFTSTYEKLGAKQALIDKLQKDDRVSAVKAYKENNKYALLLDESKLDAYIDASDFREDGVYNGDAFQCFTFMKGNSLLHYERFGYNESDLLVSTDILGYPEEVLQELRRSVVAGEINMEKIKSGEQVILRAPTFRIGQTDGATFMEKTDPTAKDAYNSTTLQVGDAITLTALVTDEMINGAVPESYLDKFRREDVTVTIGAIIRNTDGILYSSETFGQTFSLLTVNEAFEKMGIAADYSNISIYANTSYSEGNLIEHFAGYTREITLSSGNMLFENWITDTKTSRIYNMMLDVFVVTLIVLLVLTAFMILASQFYAMTRFSEKDRALLRLNGLPRIKYLRFVLAGSIAVSTIGSVLGAVFTLAFLALLGFQEPGELFHTIFYYFPPINLVYVFCGILGLSLVSVLPSIATIRKHDGNLVATLNSGE